MKRIGNSGLVPQEAYSDWPIFKEFRKTEEFKQCYENIYSEQFRDVRDDRNISLPSSGTSQTRRLRPRLATNLPNRTKRPDHARELYARGWPAEACRWLEWGR